MMKFPPRHPEMSFTSGNTPMESPCEAPTDSFECQFPDSFGIDFTGPLLTDQEVSEMWDTMYPDSISQQQSSFDTSVTQSLGTQELLSSQQLQTDSQDQSQVFVADETALALAQPGSVSSNSQQLHVQAQLAATSQDNGMQQPQQSFNGLQLQQENMQAMQNPYVGQPLSSNSQTGMQLSQPMTQLPGSGLLLQTGVPNLTQQGLPGDSFPMVAGLSNDSSNNSPGMNPNYLLSSDGSQGQATRLEMPPQAPGLNMNGNLNQQASNPSPFDSLRHLCAGQSPEVAMPHTLVDSFEVNGESYLKFKAGLVNNLSSTLNRFTSHVPSQRGHDVTKNVIANMFNGMVTGQQAARAETEKYTIDFIVNELEANGSIAGVPISAIQSQQPGARSAVTARLQRGMSIQRFQAQTDDFFNSYSVISSLLASDSTLFKEILESCQALDKDEKEFTLEFLNGNPTLMQLEQLQRILESAGGVGPSNPRLAGYSTAMQGRALSMNQPILSGNAMFGSNCMQQIQPGQLQPRMPQHLQPVQPQYQLQRQMQHWMPQEMRQLGQAAVPRAFTGIANVSTSIPFANGAGSGQGRIAARRPNATETFNHRTRNQVTKRVAKDRPRQARAPRKDRRNKASQEAAAATAAADESTSTPTETPNAS